MNDDFVDLWVEHYATLNETKRIAFLLSLKREWHRGVEDAGRAFLLLCERWMKEAIVE